MGLAGDGNEHGQGDGRDASIVQKGRHEGDEKNGEDQQAGFAGPCLVDDRGCHSLGKTRGEGCLAQHEQAHDGQDAGVAEADPCLLDGDDAKRGKCTRNENGGDGQGNPFRKKKHRGYEKHAENNVYVGHVDGLRRRVGGIHHLRQQEHGKGEEEYTDLFHEIFSVVKRSVSKNDIYFTI